MTKPSLPQQIACIERELAFREAAYYRYVSEGKRTKQWAEKELSEMRAVLETLRGLL